MFRKDTPYLFLKFTDASIGEVHEARSQTVGDVLVKPPLLEVIVERGRLNLYDMRGRLPRRRPKSPPGNHLQGLPMPSPNRDATPLSFVALEHMNNGSVSHPSGLPKRWAGLNPAYRTGTEW